MNFFRDRIPGIQKDMPMRQDMFMSWSISSLSLYACREISNLVNLVSSDFLDWFEWFDRGGECPKAELPEWKLDVVSRIFQEIFQEAGSGWFAPISYGASDGQCMLSGQWESLIPVCTAISGWLAKDGATRTVVFSATDERGFQSMVVVGPEGWLTRRFDSMENPARDLAKMIDGCLTGKSGPRP